MKGLCLGSALLGIATLLAAQALAQVDVPDIAPALQNLGERQAERARQLAAERAQQQVDAAQQRVAEQAAAQQAEAVQGQVLERVGSRLERIQEQAGGAARERVTGQARTRVEQVLGQVEGVREQPDLRPVPAAGMVLGQADANAVSPGATQQPVNDRAGARAFVELALPGGERSIAFEWIMLVTAEQSARLAGEADALMDFLSADRPFGLDGGKLLTFKVPPDVDANDGILNLVPADLRDRIDRNHVYSPRDHMTEQP